MPNTIPGFLKKVKKRRILVISAGGVDGGIQCLYFSISGDTWEIISHTSTPYPQKIATSFSTIFSSTPPATTLQELSSLDLMVSSLFTEVAKTTLSRLPTAQRRPHVILLVKPTLWKGLIGDESSQRLWDLSLGDAQLLASTLNAPVLTDFQRHNCIAGGQGSLPTEHGNLRIAAMTGGTVAFINIGLVARLTVVDTQGASVLADSDCGPGTCCINSLMRRFQNGNGNEAFDRDGTIAAEGNVDGECLKKLSGDEWFSLQTPKTVSSTNQFDHLLDDSALNALSFKDQLATITALTARTVYDIFRNACPESDTSLSVFLSGGGSHNQTLHRYLQTFFDTIQVRSIEDLGIPADMRIPLAFGLSINSWIRGEPLKWKTDQQSPLSIPGKWILP